ncbi:MAG: hypothetical protein HQM10_00055 [Candidatus Riflebacteria bacterium]|nr:hypothetical protein [Candidatus Riflebacteria bacterium]
MLKIQSLVVVFAFLIVVVNASAGPFADNTCVLPKDQKPGESTIDTIIRQVDEYDVIGNRNLGSIRTQFDILNSFVGCAKDVNEVIRLAEKCRYGEDVDKIILKGAVKAKNLDDVMILVNKCQYTETKDILLYWAAENYAQNVNDIVTLANQTLRFKKDNIILLGIKLANDDKELQYLADNARSSSTQNQIQAIIQQYLADQKKPKPSSEKKPDKKKPARKPDSKKKECRK